MNIRTLAAALSFRSKMAMNAGITFGGRRNLYESLGYKRELTPIDYRSRYRRNPVANRIVKAAPKATWRGCEIVEDGDVTEMTSFEQQWEDVFVKRLKIWDVFKRADILAGIGRYSIILIGAPGRLEDPLESAKPDDIMFLTPFAEEDATIQEYEIDVANPRFGLPKFYTVKRTSMQDRTAVNSATVGRRVHWTRCFHVADGLLDDSIFGEPRLECVWNNLDDLEKLTGGGSEAFWKRADQGRIFDIDPTLDVDEPSLAEFERKVEDYEHGLRRSLLARGVTPSTLGSDVADFKTNVESIISVISAGTGIPQRVLMGSEQGKLAAKQDRANWDNQITDRQNDWAGPCIVRPFQERMIALGALEEPSNADYDVRFSTITTMDDEQRADIAVKWASLSNQEGEVVVTADEIREHVLELPPREDSGLLAVARRKGVLKNPEVRAAVVAGDRVRLRALIRKLTE